MIEFKMIKPYIREMGTFLLGVSCACWGLLAGNFVEIIVHVHLLTVVAFAALVGLLLSFFSRIIPTGVRALIDYFLQKTAEGTYTFVEIQPYRATIFSERIGSNRERTYGMYYLIHAKKGDVVFSFLSPLFVELAAGQMAGQGTVLRPEPKDTEPSPVFSM